MRVMLAVVMVLIGMVGMGTMRTPEDAKTAFLMVVTAGYGPDGGKELERFTVFADGKFRQTVYTYGKEASEKRVEGALSAEQVAGLVKKVAEAKEQGVADDAGTVKFTWTDKEGKKQEKLYMMPAKEPAKGLVAEVRKLVKENAKEEEGKRL